MKTIIFLIPFITVIVVKKLSNKSPLAMFAGSLSCVLIAFLSNPAKLSDTFNYNLFANYISEVCLENWSIYASIYLLGQFMYLIEKSSAIYMTRHVLSDCSISRKNTGLLPVIFSMFFSVDDYLSTNTSGFLSSSLISDNKSTRKTIAVIVSFLAVSFCFISPISAWK